MIEDDEGIIATELENRRFEIFSCETTDGFSCSFSTGKVDSSNHRMSNDVFCLTRRNEKVGIDALWKFSFVEEIF